MDAKFDYDALAKYLKTYLEEQRLSARAAAEKVGCSPATLGRMLKGTQAEVIPDLNNVIRVTSWMGKSLSDFQVDPTGKRKAPENLAEVEVHLRALKGLTPDQAKALIGIVKAAYDQLRHLPPRQG